jgi:UDP-sulfoquinovose synthase
MKILVLGGDGFCGWPTSLHLSMRGHEVIIVDNLSRRKIDIELETESLTPIQPMRVRLRAWREVPGRIIHFEYFDVARNYVRKRYTVENNLSATNNVLAAIIDGGCSAHLVHLGTMGVYGYGTAGMKIPEGYLAVKVKTEDGSLIDQEILYPANSGSIYHMTKTQDQLLFAFYNKNDGVTSWMNGNPPQRGERVTILNQMTETHRVRDLAKMVSEISGASIQHVANPRREDD